MPRAAIDALIAQLERTQSRGPASPESIAELFAGEERARQRLADFVGASPDELALVDSTCTGCAMVVQGMPWRAGDHVVIGDAEYPAVVTAVERLEGRFGVTHTSVPIQMRAADAVDEIAFALRPTTRLVIVSHVLWTTGEVLDIRRIAQMCASHPNKPLLLVDGAQSVGSIHVDVRETGADFYAFPCHKHVCGPDGIGGLFVRSEALDRIEPVFAGWRGVNMEGKDGPFRPGARRFEQATTSFFTRPALVASLDVHDSWAPYKERAKQVIVAAERLHTELSKIPGVLPLLPTQPPSGLVAFRVDGHEPEAMVGKLAARGVVLRSLASTASLRATVHYLTSLDDVTALVEALAAVISQKP